MAVPWPWLPRAPASSEKLPVPAPHLGCDAAPHPAVEVTDCASPHTVTSASEGSLAGDKTGSPCAHWGSSTPLPGNGGVLETRCLRVRNTCRDEATSGSAHGVTRVSRTSLKVMERHLPCFAVWSKLRGVGLATCDATAVLRTPRVGSIPDPGSSDQGSFQSRVCRPWLASPRRPSVPCPKAQDERWGHAWSTPHALHPEPPPRSAAHGKRQLQAECQAVSG